MNLATDRLSANEPDIASKVIDGEAILINLQTGAYYSLRDAGVVIWHALREQRTRSEILSVLATTYAAEEKNFVTDLDDLLARLAEERLVRTSTQSGVTDAGVAPPSPGAYQRPELEKFTDMEELLALDPPTPGALDGLIRRPLD